MRSSTQQMSNNSNSINSSTAAAATYAASASSSTAWLDEALALLDDYDAFVADANDFASLHFADDRAALRLVTKDISVAVADPLMSTPSALKQYDEQAPAASLPTSTEQQQQLKRKRKRATPAAPTRARTDAPLKRPRKLPRLEILRMRDEVASLSSQLAELQQAQRSCQLAASSADTTTSPHSPSLATDASAVSSSERAQKELEQLQAATALNAKLKQQIAEQTALHASLEALVHTVDATETLELFEEIAALQPAAMRTSEQQTASDQGLPETHQHRPMSAPVVGNVTPSTAAALAQLHSRIEALRRETRSVCESISASSDVSTAFSHSKTTGSAAASGQTFEVVTNTPADVGFEALAEQAWGILMRLSDTTELFANTTTTKVQRSRNSVAMCVCRVNGGLCVRV